jgi:hypothetical protein
MRTRTISIFGVTAIALAVAATFTPTVSARSPDVSLTHKSSTASPAHSGNARAIPACHRQGANDTANGAVSQNFEAANNVYDNRGADDFRLKTACTATIVKVNGQYGGGPATSLHVTFYRGSAGHPGLVISNQDNLAYADPSGTGNFTIPLPSSVTFAADKRYWVSVQANMDLDPNGEWFWNTNSVATGLNAQWKNPNDGFGTGCVTYTDLLTCVPAGGPDFAFALLK